MGAAVVVHLLGAEAPIRRRQGQDLVAGGLDGAGLMGGDMAHFRRNHSLVGFQNGSDHRGVGLGAPHQKVDLGLGLLAKGQNGFPGLLAIGIGAIAGGLLQVGFLQGCQDAGMAAFGIIALELDHGVFPPTQASAMGTNGSTAPCAIVSLPV